jgi:putative transport protein
VFGRIPEAAIWVFDTVGLAVFIGVVGISAGPTFLVGVQESGLILLVVGAIVPILSHAVTILFGRYILGMTPLIVLGACAGGEDHDCRRAVRARRGPEQAAGAG